LNARFIILFVLVAGTAVAAPAGRWLPGFLQPAFGPPPSTNKPFQFTGGTFKFTGGTFKFYN